MVLSWLGDLKISKQKLFTTFYPSICDKTATLTSRAAMQRNTSNKCPVNLRSALLLWRYYIIPHGLISGIKFTQGGQFIQCLHAKCVLYRERQPILFGDWEFQDK